jgi:phosphosulfolactate synthase (CoM biosynthesis protein A)
MICGYRNLHKTYTSLQNSAIKWSKEGLAGTGIRRGLFFAPVDQPDCYGHAQPQLELFKNKPPQPQATKHRCYRDPRALYTVVGKRYLEDVLETMGNWIDAVKFAGGSFFLFPPAVLAGFIDTAHQHDVKVSTGGFMEYVITRGSQAVRQYIETCSRFGFDIIEISSGFITLPADDWLRLIEWVMEAGMKAKPEVGIQFGAGGASAAADLQRAGSRDAAFAVKQAKRFIGAGVSMIMIESEGITENVKHWRTDVIEEFVNELGLEHLMFEAADPAVFEWYIRNYGHAVNLFVDHSQIVQLECLRQGIWGTEHSWGRIKGLE